MHGSTRAAACLFEPRRASDNTEYGNLYVSTTPGLGSDLTRSTFGSTLNSKFISTAQYFVLIFYIITCVIIHAAKFEQTGSAINYYYPLTHDYEKVRIFLTKKINYYHIY